MLVREFLCVRHNILGASDLLSGNAEIFPSVVINDPHRSSSMLLNQVYHDFLRHELFSLLSGGKGS